jgi:hypothetical protein
MGGGKSSGSSSAVLTPEQKELLSLQTNALKETFLPAYQKTVTGAEERMNLAQPYVNEAAKSAYAQAGDISQSGTQAGKAAYGAGLGQLGQLFDPNYEKNQINAALQAGRESARESQAGQNAMYGAAGGLGSSRMALADQNLASLNAQRQATAAAGAQSQVQQNRMAAANSMLGAGQNLINTGLGAASQQVGYAGAPLDLYSKYAGIVYGTPQASTTPNFAGTQGSTGSSKGFGVSGAGAKSLFGG